MADPRLDTLTHAPRLGTDPEPDPAPPTGIDRRRSTRESQITVATLQPASGDASVDRQVLVFNLSLGGVGFRASQRFQPGEVFRITLGTGPLFLNAKLRVVSCRGRADGTFDVGAAFC